MAPLLLWGGGAALLALVMTPRYSKPKGEYSIGIIVTDWPSTYGPAEVDNAVDQFVRDLGGASDVTRGHDENGSSFYTYYSTQPLLAPGETVSIDDGNITIESVDVDDLF